MIHVKEGISSLICVLWHLFSDYSYFDMLRRDYAVVINNNWTRCQTGDIFDAAPKNLHEMASLYLALAIYNTWKERNLRMHNFTAGRASMTLIRDIKTTDRRSYSLIIDLNNMWSEIKHYSCTCFEDIGVLKFMTRSLFKD